MIPCKAGEGAGRLRSKGSHAVRSPQGRWFRTEGGIAMRLVMVLALVALGMGLWGNPAWGKGPLGADVTVIQGSKRLYGWVNNYGRIQIQNASGRTIMFGAVTKMGSVELNSELTDESYVGRINSMGYGLLMSPVTGETIRIEIER